MDEHSQLHFNASEVVRDTILGLSDGLTVPFALAAGLTGAIAASSLIVTAGMAEIAAGAISMGLGGYLAARSEADHYVRELRVEEREVAERPDRAAEATLTMLTGYGLQPQEAQHVLDGLRENSHAWVDFMLLNELGLDRPDNKRALISAVTIGGAYVVGGIVPLLPYFFVTDAKDALWPSIILTLTALGLFGIFKAWAAHTNRWLSALQTMLVGGAAAAAAYWIASLFS
jgi:VIT1/CCC1 family predicted Fe2+/Mn2+ transporter